MKKKILAMMLSLTMVLNTFSVAGAAEFEFTDGEITEVVELEEVVVEEYVPEEAELFDDGDVVIEDNEVPVAEEAPSPDAKQLGENVWVEFDDVNKIATISGSGPMWDFYEDGMDYTKEHKNPFWNAYSEYGVVVQDDVTRIGSNAFRGTRIKSIDFGKGIQSIGAGAFQSQSWITKVELPNGIEKIEEYAFSGCNSIEEINIPNSVVEIGDSCFGDCMNLKRVNVGTSVTDIPAYCFVGCQSLEMIVMSDSIKSICNSAFANCIGLTSIILPKQLEMIGTYAFWNCRRLETIVIPSTVKQLGQYALKECTALQNISFEGNAFREIPYQFLYGCESLISLVIPNGVTYIDREAFNDCVGLQEITIPKSVGGIQEGTFNRCYNLKLIKGYKNSAAERYANEHAIKFEAIDGTGQTPEGKIQVGKEVFASIEGDTLTLSGNGSTYDYGWDEWGETYYTWLDKEEKDKIATVIIQDGITRIGNGLFQEFTNLINISFPEGLIELGNEAFSLCTSLSEFTIPEGVYKIGKGILDGCSSVKKVSFPSTLKEIPVFANEYEGISKLETVVLAEGIEIIDEFAFCHHPKLRSIKIPSTVKEIGEGAFDYSGFIEFNWPENVKSIEKRMFEGDVYLKNVYLSDGVVSIGEYAFRDCTRLKSIYIPSSVNDIDVNAFYGCSDFYIVGQRDSFAEKFANEYKIPFRTGDFKVLFKNNGRTEKTEYVMAGKDATPPELTPREGYTLSWDADYTNIQEDMIINAVWTKNDDSSTEPPIIIYPPEETKYTVTFKDRGKTIKTEKVKSGEAADIPYIDRYGYELSWDKDFSNVTSNMTVNAVWTIIEPAKVTNLTGEIISKKISLSWDESEYAGYYKIYRKASSDEKFTLVARTSQTLWNDRRAKTGVEYEYKAIAVRSVGGELYTSPESDVVTVKLGDPEVGRIYTVGNLNYKVMNTSEVRVTGAAKVSGSVYIPNTVTISDKVFEVTSIDHKAFYKNENIVNVRIGNYVTYVGQYSFYRCPNLKSVRFGKNVEVISTCAFTECPKLGNIVLPEKVKRLGAKVFYHCPNLKVLYIKTNNLEYIGKKGLAIDKQTIIKVPSRKYSTYKKMIEDSVKFSATKIVKL